MTIPPREDGSFALPNHEALHIWPQKEFMLIALPNPDKSFTATLFAPYHGVDGFDHIDSTKPEAILKYFKKHFPELVPLMPNLVKDFQENPVGSLLTLKVKPWNMGKLLLIGDAAHAVVPFFGQGMNAAFQDGFMLYQMLKEEIMKVKSLGASEGISIDLESCIAKFSAARQPSTDALSDICLDHYYDMAVNTTSTLYLLERKVESFLTNFLPNTYFSLYRMVAFTDMPYHVAWQRAKRQELWIQRLCVTSLAMVGLAIAGSLGHRLISNFPAINSNSY